MMKDYDALNQLSIVELLQSEEWPQAVDARLVCNPDSDAAKQERAARILDLFVEEPLEGKAFLDFGCGEGHVAAHAAAESARISVGFDIVSSGSLGPWEQGASPFFLTTDLSKVMQYAPFDIILVYDVLDHLGEASITELLDVLRKLSRVGTRIVVRCHPWYSRHGGHLYHSLNKAFAHLVLAPDELRSLGMPSPSSQSSIDYSLYFPQKPPKYLIPEVSVLNAGLFSRLLVRNARNVVGSRLQMMRARRRVPQTLPAEWRSVTREAIEPFFSEVKEVRSRINRRLGLPEAAPLPIKLLEETFVDFLIIVSP